MNGHECFTGGYLSSLRSSRRHRSLSSWISHLLHKRRHQETLHLTDLYDLLPEHESTALTDQLEDRWLDEVKRRPDRPSLLRATIRTMGWKPFFIGCNYIPEVCIDLASFSRKYFC